MNKRNFVIASAIAALLGTGAVVAGGKYCEHGGDGKGYHQRGHQGGMHGGKGMQRMLRHLDGELELTDEQTAAIEAIMDARRDARGDRRGDRHALMREAMKLDPMAEDYDARVAELADQVGEMARSRALEMAETRKQVAGILTPGQREELRSMMEKRMKRKGHRHGDKADDA